MLRLGLAVANHASAVGAVPCMASGSRSAPAHTTGASGAVLAWSLNGGDGASGDGASCSARTPATHMPVDPMGDVSPTGSRVQTNTPADELIKAGATDSTTSTVHVFAVISGYL